MATSIVSPSTTEIIVALTAIAVGATVVADASAWQAVVSTAMQTRIVRIRCVLSVASHIR